MSVLKIIIILGTVSLILPGLEAYPLFKNGKTDWKIVVPVKAHKTEIYAAWELKNTLKKLSGADFPIIKRSKETFHNIYIGTPLSSKDIYSNQLKLDKNNKQALAVYCKNGNLYLGGTSPRGVLYAVYFFLRHQLNVRWLWPGKNGEFINKMAEFELPQRLEMNYSPIIKYRGYHGLHGPSPETEIWITRNFGNIIRYGIAGEKKQIAERQKRGCFIYATGHNVILSAKDYFKSHPEYFAWDGKKRIKDQLCWNNKGAEEAIVKKLSALLDKFPQIEILGMYPADNRNYCECELCRKNSISTNWFDFYNRVRKRIAKRYPKLKFTTIAYQGYIDVPRNLPQDTEFIEYAMYDRCYVHNIEKCNINATSVRRIKKWADAQCNIGIYGYEFDIFTPRRMLPIYQMLADQIQYFKNNKIISVIPEICVYGYPASKPREERMADQMRLAWYLYLNLMFDPDSDWKKLIYDWCRSLYPAAADPMSEYHVFLAKRWSNMKSHLSVYGLPPAPVVGEMLDVETVDKIEKLFESAKRLIMQEKNKDSREQQIRELEFEKKLLQQWLDAYNNRIPDIVTLPHNSQVDDKFKYQFLSKNNLAISGSWDSKQLQLCFYPNKKYLKKKFKFAVKSPYGVKRDFSINVALGMPLGVSISFADLGGKPLAYSTYVISFELDGKIKQIAVCLSVKKKISKRMLFALPRKNEPLKYYPNLREALIKSDWQADFVTDLDELRQRDLSQYTTIAVAMNNNKIPAEYFQEKLLPFIKQGGMVILGGYEVQADKLFDEPKFSLKQTGILPVSSRKRKTSFLANGRWKNYPCNLEKSLNRYCTPVRGYEVPHEGTWKVLAKMPKSNKQTCAYILYQPVGKGVLLVISSSLGLEHYLKWVIGGCSYLNSTVYFFNNMFEFRNDVFK